MATIGTSLQGLSLSSVLAAQGPYYRTQKGQTAKYLPLSSVNNKQVGINYAGFSFNFLYEGLDDSLVNSLNKSYKVQKNTSRTEFNEAMGEATRVSSALRNINYQKAEEKAEKLKEGAKESAETLKNFIKSADFGKKERESLTEALSAFQNFVDSPGKDVSVGESEAGTSVQSVGAALEINAGLSSEQAASASVAAQTAMDEVDHYLSVGEGTAAYLRKGLETIQGSIARFEQLGRFEIDTKRANAVLGTMQQELTRSSKLTEAVEELSGFAGAYKLDDDANSTEISLDALTKFSRGLPNFDEDMTKRLNNSVGAVRQFLAEGKYAADSTVAEAKEATGVLADMAEIYADSVALTQEDQNWLWTAANDMKNLSQGANEPFKELGRLKSFADDYRVAEKEAVGAARDMADDIQALLNKYNDTVTYLQDKRGMSTRFDSVNLRSAGETQEFTHSLKDIGVSVDFTGALTTDKEKLTTALQESPDKVAKALGEGGLADRIEKSVSQSSYQTGRLSPTINSLAARSTSLLSPQWTVAAMMYKSGGYFMDMYS